MAPGARPSRRSGPARSPCRWHSARPAQSLLPRHRHLSAAARGAYPPELDQERWPRGRAASARGLTGQAFAPSHAVASKRARIAANGRLHAATRSPAKAITLSPMGSVLTCPLALGSVVIGIAPLGDGSALHLLYRGAIVPTGAGKQADGGSSAWAEGCGHELDHHLLQLAFASQREGYPLQILRRDRHPVRRGRGPRRFRMGSGRGFWICPTAKLRGGAICPRARLRGATSSAAAGRVPGNAAVAAGRMIRMGARVVTHALQAKTPCAGVFAARKQVLEEALAGNAIPPSADHTALTAQFPG